jgi:hypothetical protein
MARAEFEEKEYELAFSIELGAGHGPIFSSGQVLEKVLGYDAATHPERDSVIWRLLQVRRPQGLRLVQPMWSPGAMPPILRLPAHPVSLLLQYKRPDHMVGPSAAQWNLWGRPYFRFARADRQHRILSRLERKLRGEALVRYAAPAFATRAELEYHHLRRTVIERSGFVAPMRIGRHRVWTYESPGNHGLPNPRGRSALFETFQDLYGEVRRMTEPVPETRSDIVPYRTDQLWAHLVALGAAARYRNPTLRAKVHQWLDRAIDEDVPTDTETLRRVGDIASITTLMAQINGTWHLIADPGET